MLEAVLAPVEASTDAGGKIAHETCPPCEDESIAAELPVLALCGVDVTDLQSIDVLPVGDSVCVVCDLSSQCPRCGCLLTGGL